MTKGLKARLKSGRPCVGSWISLAHPAVAEIMARAGFHWLAVDLEHSVITVREAEELIRTIEGCGVIPLVRLTSNDPDLIKRVMDAGAHGVIVPMVNDKAGAERAVSAVHYPPRGTRGVGLARAQAYGTAFQSYRAWVRREAAVFVMIEHKDGVRNADAILSVDGVDGYFMGPYDLSASLGVPGKIDHPKVRRAMRRVKEAGARARKPGGLHVVEPDPALLKRHARAGYRMLAYSVDFRMLDVSCRRGLAALKGA